MFTLVLLPLGFLPHRRVHGGYQRGNEVIKRYWAACLEVLLTHLSGSGGLGFGGLSGRHGGWVRRDMPTPPLLIGLTALLRRICWGQWRLKIPRVVGVTYSGVFRLSIWESASHRHRTYGNIIYYDVGNAMAPAPPIHEDVR